MQETPLTRKIASAPALALLALLASPGMLAAQGVPLGVEFRVNTTTASNQEKPAVASDSAGNFVVAWQSNAQEGYGQGIGVFAQRFSSAGNALGGEFHVNTTILNNQIFPAVASDSAGNFVVAWAQSPDGNGYGVFAQRYSSTGAPLGVEFRVNTYTPDSQNGAAVASDAAGNFVVVWYSRNQEAAAGFEYGIFGQRYSSTGATLGLEFRVNTFTTDVQKDAAVASTPSGDFVVAWRSFGQDLSRNGVYAQRYSSTGAPLGGEFQVNTYTTEDQTFPSVASDAAGNFVIAWQSTPYNGTGQDGDVGGVFAQRYASTGVALGGEFRVNTVTTSGQGAPNVAADPAGNFVVAWNSLSAADGSAYGVFGQRYSSAGSPLGGEFRINTYTPSGQDSPSVATDGAGNFVVTWESYTQDDPGANAFGVYAQRYGAILPVELLNFGVE